MLVAFRAWYSTLPCLVDRIELARYVVTGMGEAPLFYMIPFSYGSHDICLVVGRRFLT